MAVSEKEGGEGIGEKEKGGSGLRREGRREERRRRGESGGRGGRWGRRGGRRGEVGEGEKVDKERGRKNVITSIDHTYSRP